MLLNFNMAAKFFILLLTSSESIKALIDNCYIYFNNYLCEFKTILRVFRP